jgi:PPOX class probable F420-dependent enzyme
VTTTMTTDDRLAPFRDQRTILLTTFRRTGEGVGTPVNVVVDGDRAFVRTWSTSGKAKRLRRDPHVRIAPATRRGRPTGEAIDAEARPARPDDVARARSLLRRKHPLLQGVLVPVSHRLLRYRTVHYEVRLTA